MFPLSGKVDLPGNPAAATVRLQIILQISSSALKHFRLLIILKSITSKTHFVFTADRTCSLLWNGGLLFLIREPRQRPRRLTGLLDQNSPNRPFCSAEDTKSHSSHTTTFSRLPATFMWRKNPKLSFCFNDMFSHKFIIKASN